MEELAEAGAELGQGAPPVPWETPFRFVDGRGAGAQHPVDGVVLDGGLDSASVDGLDGVLVVSFLHDPIGEEVRDRRQELGAEGDRGVPELLMGPYARLMDWGGDDREAGVGGAECACSKLLAEHPQVDLHR